MTAANRFRSAGAASLLAIATAFLSANPIHAGAPVRLTEAAIAPHIANSSGDHNHHDHSEPDHSEHGHAEPKEDDLDSNHDHYHSSLEVDPSQPIPTVSLTIVPDTMRGWNLNLITTHFELSGASAGQANQPGQGHAHLYVNGEKRARLYGNWYHLTDLPSGEVEIEVTLNSNQHHTLTHNDVPIAASQIITVD